MNSIVIYQYLKIALHYPKTESRIENGNTPKKEHSPVLNTSQFFLGIKTIYCVVWTVEPDATLSGNYK
jgi:hypothetical protein